MNETKPSNSIVWAIVILVGFVSAAVVASIFRGELNTNAPTLTAFFGFVGAIVVPLLALSKINKVNDVVQQTRADLHNGLIPAKVREVLHEEATPRDESLRERESDGH